jgi:hypothetical protein
MEQNQRCALSGQELSFSRNSRNKKDSTASLDRIDSLDGYVIGNVQWIHKDINRMKSDFDEKHFIDICHMIAKFRGVK